MWPRRPRRTCGRCNTAASAWDPPVVLEGQSFRSPAARANPLVNWEVVTPDYFTVLGIALTAGRFFTVADTADSEPVVMLGESAARRLWPNDNAIGKRLMGRLMGRSTPAGRAPMAEDRRDRRGRAVSRDHRYAP